MKETTSLISKLKSKGKNFNRYLRKNSNLSESEIIQLSYDFQSGDYIKRYDPVLVKRNLTPVIDEIIKEKNIGTLLDFGSGELTSFSYILKKLNKTNIKFFACDISFNRLFLGSQLLKKKKLLNKSVNLFCNDFNELPFLDNSIDVIITNHAIEPNKSNAEKLIMELYRVARRKLILQEPNYNIACKLGKKRMISNNYVINFKQILRKNNLKFEIIDTKFNFNDLNPSSLYIINKQTTKKNNYDFICRDSRKNLTNIENFYFSEETGNVFPILDNIAVFNKNFFFFKKSI